MIFFNIRHFMNFIVLLFNYFCKQKNRLAEHNCMSCSHWIFQRVLVVWASFVRKNYDLVKIYLLTKHTESLWTIFIASCTCYKVPSYPRHRLCLHYTYVYIDIDIDHEFIFTKVKRWTYNFSSKIAHFVPIWLINFLSIMLFIITK